MKKNYPYAYCGVYWGQCANGNGKVKTIAGELKRLVDIVRYEWLELPNVKLGFRFSEFRKGLEWFAAAQCPKCQEGGGPPFLRNTKMLPREESAKLPAVCRFLNV